MKNFFSRTMVITGAFIVVLLLVIGYIADVSSVVPLFKEHYPASLFITIIVVSIIFIFVLIKEIKKARAEKQKLEEEKRAKEEENRKLEEANAEKQKIIDTYNDSIRNNFQTSNPAHYMNVINKEFKKGKWYSDSDFRNIVRPHARMMLAVDYSKLVMEQLAEKGYVDIQKDSLDNIKIKKKDA